MTVTIPPSHEAFGRERKNKRPKDNGQDKGTRKGRQNKEWAASLVTTQTEHKERKRHKLQQEKKIRTGKENKKSEAPQKIKAN